jgi:hypothetical protein
MCWLCGCLARDAEVARAPAPGRAPPRTMQHSALCTSPAQSHCIAAPLPPTRSPLRLGLSLSELPLTSEPWMCRQRLHTSPQSMEGVHNPVTRAQRRVRSRRSRTPRTNPRAPSQKQRKNLFYRLNCELLDNSCPWRPTRPRFFNMGRVRCKRKSSKPQHQNSLSNKMAPVQPSLPQSGALPPLLPPPLPPLLQRGRGQEVLPKPQAMRRVLRQATAGPRKRAQPSARSPTLQTLPTPRARPATSC